MSIKDSPSGKMVATMTFYYVWGPLLENKGGLGRSREISPYQNPGKFERELEIKFRDIADCAGYCCWTVNRGIYYRFSPVY